MTVETLEKANEIFWQIKHCKKFMMKIQTVSFKYENDLDNALIEVLVKTMENYIADLEKQFEELKWN